ncbi:photosystem I light harvesting complex gene 3 [Striga asiatica]|uniref:Photosystem I light harvesting complex gene 3 n=1 Tax=Striga asiatica TaxID=4170 RepID=A0A5A7P4M2_STRAF|nr:photosystem I light harvesting complex gene 3 [Striga asiatica]
MPEKLIFPRKSGPTRTKPLVPPTVLLVRFQIGNHGEFLRITPAASVRFVAMSSLVVIFHAQNRLQRLELAMILVSLAAHKRARVPLDKNLLGTRFFMGLRQCSRSFVLIPMTPHVHA